MKAWMYAAVVAAGLAAGAPAAMADELVVSAAASLTNAFKDVAKQFEARHPGTKVLTSFGASDVVLQQIVNGAPADVFASADEKAMDKAVAQKAVDPATRKDFARNGVVLIVPADSRLGLHDVKDLKRAEVKRVTYGNPSSVPVGRYTEASLKQAGMWQPLQSKAVLAQNVRQALDYVARGEVDAGFVFGTDAAIMPDKVKVVQALPAPKPVLYPIAVVARKGVSPHAGEFVKFVLSEPGQAILARYGFKKP